MNRWMLALSIGASALAFEQAAFAGDEQPPVVTTTGGAGVQAGAGAETDGGAAGNGGVNAGAGVGADGKPAGTGITGMKEHPDVDGPRFRGGIALDVGALIFPGGSIAAVGLAGLQGTTGVQINHLVGVYVVPGFDVLFGDVGGVGLTAALMVDFTINHLFTVGAGPDVGVFAAIGGDASGASGVGGLNYGARLHTAVHPVVGRSNERRQAFSIGLDMRFLGGANGQVEVGPNGESAAVTSFLFSPYLTIGYSAF